MVDRAEAALAAGVMHSFECAIEYVAHEGVEFALVSIGGMLIGLFCLWVSRYVLGFDNLLADNIAGNVIGLGLGTLFRFTLYKLWVFAPRRGERMPLFPATEEGEATVTEAADQARPSPR